MYSSPKKYTLNNFDNINSPAVGSVIATINDNNEYPFTNDTGYKIITDKNNLSILTDKKRGIFIGQSFNNTYIPQSNNIFIGNRVGESLPSTCQDNIAIGYWAMKSSFTGACSSNIALGREAMSQGITNTCIHGISVGYLASTAGKCNYNIAIGYASGIGQNSCNSITLSAFGNLNSPTASALYIRPIRSMVVAGMPTQAMSYNTTTGEWTYNP